MMTSINKCLTIALVASLLLSAALSVQADGEQQTTPQPSTLGTLRSKLLSTLKSAGSSILSHIPYLNGQTNQTVTTPSSVEQTVTSPVPVTVQTEAQAATQQEQVEIQPEAQPEAEAESQPEAGQEVEPEAQPEEPQEQTAEPVEDEPKGEEEVHSQQ